MKRLKSREYPEFVSADVSWMKKIEEDLNPVQYRFATINAPVIMGLAGPGSGKTRALVYRASHLIKSGISPHNILLVTFTNKAAGEMKCRLEQLLGEPIKDLWAGTFHSIGARILRINAPLVERSSRFTILDENDRASILKNIFNGLKEGIDEKEKNFFIRRGFTGRVISQASNSGRSIDEIMEEYHWNEREYTDLIKRVAEKYESVKKESDAFDFDDLMTKWLELFQNHTGALDRYRRRFQHVMVDEFQDTNYIQGRLVDLMVGFSSVCVVGDDAQSIYAFRFADVDNMVNFPERHPDCLIARMEQNYRSTPQIVGLSGHVISFNRHQLKKELFSLNPGGETPLAVSSRNAYGEASFVIQKVSDLLSKGVPLREIAVLYRSSYLTQELELELINRGIPYRTFGGLRLLQKSHIKDVLAWLKVLYNPLDGISWRRIINMQPGLGPASGDYVVSRLAESEDPLVDVLSGKISPRRGKQGWKGLVNILEESRHEDKAADTIQRILTGGYYRIMQSLYPDDWEERYLGIERMASYSLRFEDKAEFLETLTLEDTLFLEAEDENMQEYLTLSTIHSAKGKEWDAVFILALNNGHFPAYRGITDLEEERRLFYVAASRARKQLFLSTYRLDYRQGLSMVVEPSIFLKELDPSTYETLFWE